MTKLEATLIRALRDIGCTWRRIAEIYADGSEDADTSQQRGRELCHEAAKVLGVEDLDDE
jgi:hypothetical protein